MLRYLEYGEREPRTSLRVNIFLQAAIYYVDRIARRMPLLPKAFSSSRPQYPAWNSEASLSASKSHFGSIQSDLRARSQRQFALCASSRVVQPQMNIKLPHLLAPTRSLANIYLPITICIDCIDIEAIYATIFDTSCLRSIKYTCLIYQKIYLITL